MAHVIGAIASCVKLLSAYTVKWIWSWDLSTGNSIRNLEDLSPFKRTQRYIRATLLNNTEMGYSSLNPYGGTLLACKVRGTSGVQTRTCVTASALLTGALDH